jgi:predicted nucleic acid-binding protein
MQRGDPLRVAVFAIAELEVGVAKCSRPTRERRAMETCIEPFEVVGFTQSTARIFGSLIGRLETEGQPISDMDGLIASVALELGEPLVTRNPKHFQRVPGLRLETYT